MKRKHNTLDAEYKRRGPIRPSQVYKTRGTLTVNGRLAYVSEGNGVASSEGVRTERFDWKGTTVWGVSA